MCKTCTHTKVCKDKGDYAMAWSELQQPRIATFEAVLKCANYYGAPPWDLMIDHKKKKLLKP